MIKPFTLMLALGGAMIAMHPHRTQAESTTNPLTPVPHRMEIAGGDFLFDGKPTRFLCGEMHYFRIPKELWRDRLHKARVMGLNCVSAYVFWSFHEREPGVFDFSGPADVAEFVRLAQQEGLFVFLRPGPYVCAEYDFGGYPYWLQNIKGMKWRADDPKFLECMERYLQALAKELAPLQVTKGGPIALVQVENEYGSYGNDKVYLAKIRDMVRKAGFEVPLTTCDGGGQMPRGTVDGCLPTINGVLGQQVIDTINKHHPGGPYFVAEFYPAWFDNWGDRHSTKDRHTAARDYEWMLANNISVSMYMFHGGTNFWYTNGANSPPYRAQPTSYDYDAPLSESGRMTEKFMLFREAALRHLPPGESLPPVPPQPKVVTVPPFELTESAALDSVLPKPVRAAQPLTFEDLQLDFGYVLYRTQLTQPVRGKLRCEDVRHYAWVMVNGRIVGRMDRRHGQDTVDLVVDQAPARLEILVENVGRVNYGAALLNNRCGLVKPVTLDGKELPGWDNYPLPLYKLNPADLKFGPSLSKVPAFHRGSFELKETGEIFLDTSHWGKGAVWVNGHSLGKFWRIGPQQTLYLPSCWTRVGRNEVVVLELDDQGNRTLAGLAEPVLDQLQEGLKAKARPGRKPVLDPGDLVLSGNFSTATEPQTARFAKPVSARHLALEITSGHGDNYACMAEFEVLGADGKPLPRGQWQVWYVSSEERVKELASAENMIDGKRDTFWHSEWAAGKDRHPYTVVIDLGEIKGGLSGIRYTPRSDRPNGRLNAFRVFARPQFFLSKE